MERPFPAYVGSEPYVFVCYAHEDAELVYPDIARLAAQGINVWYDEGVAAGSNWRAAIGDSLLGAAKVAFYVSAGSLASDHCNREINLALDEGLEIVPIYLEEVALTSDLRVGLSRIQALTYQANGAHLRALTAGADSIAAPGLESQTHTPARHRWVPYAISALVLVLLAVGAQFYGSSSLGEDDSLEERSIIVIPLRNLSPDALSEYVVDGLTAELVRVLSGVSGLKVAPSTASFSLKGRPVDLVELGEEMGFQLALEGSVRSAGNQVIVSISLIQIADQRVLESFTLTGRQEETLALHEDVAVRAVNELSVVRRPEELRHAASAGTANEKAYSLFLQANELNRRDNAEDLLKAEVLIQAAVDEDPKFARAWGLYGAILFSASARTGRTQHYYEELVRMNKRVERIFGAGAAPAAVSGSAALMFFDGEWSRQEEMLAEQFRNGAAGHLTYQLYGYLLANAGLFEAALSFNQRSVELNPFNPRALEQTGDMLRLLSRHDEALAAFRRCQLLSPARSGCFNEIGITLDSMGRIDAARAHFGDRLVRPVACILELSTDCEFKEGEGNLTSWGYVAAMQGRMDEAFELLERAVREHDIFVRQIRWQQPEAAGLTQEDRYPVLLEALGLTDDWQRKLCSRAQALTPASGIPVVCESQE